MAPFMQQPTAAGDDDSATIKTAMENDNSMMEYDLCGLISHRGQNMECKSVGKRNCLFSLVG